ncbi:hypothetical protein FGRMN_6419 [Fusarium graminum]|nr:hypothetical protein FGRMN_6419 [Fusarium graminum]
MAPQFGSEFLPDEGLVLPDPYPGLALPGDVVEKRLEGLDLPSLNNIPLDQIFGSANLSSRRDVELPELSDYDSDLDEQPEIYSGVTSKYSFWSAKPPSSSRQDERSAFIGGALVRNICLVVPDQNGKGFTDLPVQPVRASHGQPAQLLAKISKNKDEKFVPPILVLPDEREPVQGSYGFNSSLGLWSSKPSSSSSTMTKKDASDLTKITKGIDDMAKKEELGKTEMKNFVLSGDIDNFWGRKGLTVKLYKHQTEKPDEDEKKTKDEVAPDAKASSGESGKGDAPTESKPKVEPKPDDKDKKDGEVQGGKESKDEKKKDKDKSVPVVEKIKLNTDNIHFKKKPLAALFPLIDNDNIKNLAADNLEIVYTEEKDNFLYKPGLRIEFDVKFQDGLAWADQAMKNLLKPKDTPASIHLSAHLSDTRDWSKAPKIENLILQGSFLPMSLTAWDILNFKTLGVEITATKAPVGKSSKSDKSKGGDAEKENPAGEKVEDRDSDDDDQVKAEEPESTELAASAEDSADQETEEKETRGDVAEIDNEKDTEKEKKDNKSKEKKSWYFGFAFIGTLRLMNIPHANAPLEMNYRLARDFVPAKVEEKEAKEDSKKDKKEGDKKEDGNKKIEKSNTDDKVDAKSLEKIEEPDEKTKKKEEDKEEPKHKRKWNFVVKADEWKDIYGVKNLTMSKAELKSSFNEGEFRATVELEVSGEFKLGSGTVKARGHFSRDDNYLEAEVGDLTLTDIKKIHNQIHGIEQPKEETKTSAEKDKMKVVSDKKKADEKKTDDEKKKEEDKKKDEDKKAAEGNEITFKEVKLNLSRKKLEKEKVIRYALEFNSKVTFNGHASASANLIIAREGLTITGGIKDFQIPNHQIWIKRAGLQIFIAFKWAKDAKALEEKKVKEGDSDKDAKTIEESKTESLSEAIDKLEDEKSPAKVDDKPSDKALTSKKKEVVRESKFGIVGVVKIDSVTIEVGLYTEKKKDEEKREWLAFGTVKTIRLRDAWNKIPVGSFLDLQLENVALIASSKERKKKKNDEKDDKKDKDSKDEKSGKESSETTKKEKDGLRPKAITAPVSDGDSKDEKNAKKDSKKEGKEKKDGDQDSKDEKSKEKEKELDSWDVLGTVDAYNYPIVKGVQLCATITSFTELEFLNNGEKIEGLTLIISIDSKGKFGVSIDLPRSFKVRLSDCASLGNFGTTIGFGSSGPELQLRAMLTLTFTDSAPICVEGVLVGTTIGAQGHLKMSDESKWKNPFNLNENLVVSRLGVGTGFTWVNVMATGPSRLALSGQVDIGEFKASLDIGLDYVNAGTLLKFTMNKLDVMQVAQFTGVLTNNIEMQQLKRNGDMLVFHDLLFYLSSGAEFLGTYYERGIRIKGKMQFFNKKGEFDGRFDDDGVVIKAGIDNFKIGGLEITSTREDVKRATMDIELTKGKQKVFIDGRLSYHDLLISILLDVDVEKRQFKADVTIKFLEKLSIKLKANVKAEDVKALEKADMSFEGTLDADIFGAIEKGIERGIDALKQLATDKIDQARKSLQSELKKQKIARDEMKAELEEYKAKLTKETLKKQDEIEEENKELKRLVKKLDEARRAVNDAESAKTHNQRQIDEKRQEKMQAKAKLESAKLKIQKKYEANIRKEQANQRMWEMKKKQLIDSRDARWGDTLRSAKAADISWAWWVEEEKSLYDWKTTCENKGWNAYWWDKPYWWAKLAEATLGLEKAHAQKKADAELRHAGKAIMESEPFRAAENSIHSAVKEIEKFGKAVDALQSKGLWGWVEEMSKNEDQEFRRQIRELGELENKSIELENALQEAKKALDATFGDLTPKQEEARHKIENLKKEMKMMPAQQKFDKKKAEVDNMEVIVNDLISKLDKIENSVEDMAQVVKAAVTTLGKASPKITRIAVNANSRTFVANKPLVFKIEANWLGETNTFDVEWAPNESPAALYDEAVKLLMSWGQLMMEPPAPKPPAKPPASIPKTITASQPKPLEAKPVPVPKTIAPPQPKPPLAPEPVADRSSVEANAPSAKPIGPASDVKIRILHRPLPSSEGKPRWSTFDCQKWQDNVVDIPDITIQFETYAVTLNGEIWLFFHEKKKSGPGLDYGPKSFYARFTWNSNTIRFNSLNIATGCVFNSAVVFQDRVYILYRSNNVGFGYINDSGDLSKCSFPDNSACKIATVVFRQLLYVFHRDVRTSKSHDGTRLQCYDGDKWRGKGTVPNTTMSWNQIAVVYRGRLYLLHHETEGKKEILWTTHDGETWSGNKRIKGCSPEDLISSVVYEDKIFVFYNVKTDLYQVVFDGETWEIQHVPGVKGSPKMSCLVW